MFVTKNKLAFLLFLTATIWINVAHAQCTPTITVDGVLLNSDTQVTICPQATKTLVGPAQNVPSGAVYTYQWYYSASSNNQSDHTAIAGATNREYIASAAGYYSLRVVNSAGSGCSSYPDNPLSNTIAVNISSSVSVTITGDNQLSLPSNNIYICNGQQRTLTGPVNTGYSYVWKRDGIPISGETSSSITTNVIGAYTLEVTNSVGCTFTSSNTVNLLNPTTSISPPVVTDITCYGAANGSISVATGNSLSWNSIVGGILTNLTPGVYTGVVYIDGATGCETVLQPITINEPAPISAIVSANNVTCTGGSDGIIAISSASGGTLPYLYSIGNSFLSNQNFNNLIAGNYNVQIKDANNCIIDLDGVTNTIITEPNAGVISGNTAICMGGSGSLSSSIAGGTWSSATPSVATINANTGVITPVAAGQAIIQYSITGTAPCSISTSSVTVAITFPPTPGTISGNTSVCPNGTTTLSSTVTGGSWSSSNNTTATVNATTGVVTGVAPGTSIITYTVAGTGGCSDVSTSVTINVITPYTVPMFSGSNTVCVGSNTTFTKSTYTSPGTVNQFIPASGSISNPVGQNCVVYDANGSGDYGNGWDGTIVLQNNSSFSITVSGTHNAEGGNYDILRFYDGAGIGGTLLYTDQGGGVGNNVNITHTFAPGQIITIRYTTDGSITGPGPQLNVTYNHPWSSLSGVWSSSDPSVASINASTGVATGISVGTTNINYTLSSNAASNTCYTTPSQVLTVPNPQLPAITGTTVVCAGATTVLSNTISGGSWSSSNTAVATVSSNGTVSGVAAGTSTITYTVIESGCTRTSTVSITVNPSPSATITSSSSVICAGGLVNLSVAVTTGDTYQWNLDGIAISGATAAAYTATVAGTYTATATNSLGCSITSVNATITASIPISIPMFTGPNTLCIGSDTTFTPGTYSGPSTITQLIPSSGNITNPAGQNCVVYDAAGSGNYGNNWDGYIVLQNNSNYTITVSGGTFTGESCCDFLQFYDGIGTSGTVMYTIYANSAIPNFTTAPGQIITVRFYADGSQYGQGPQFNVTYNYPSSYSSGVWSSSDSSVASINASTGVATGISGGTTNINYLVSSNPVSNGCSTEITKVLTVPNPQISGTTSVGAGDSVTLTATTAAASSNAWVSSAPTVASVSNTGVVNGLTTGTTTITYTNSNGCTDTEIITVIVGTTQPPVLTSPVTNTIGATTLNINYTLPETPLSGSVNLTFTPVGGGTPIVWTMNNATSAIFSHVVGSNPTSSSNVVSGAVLGFTTYDVTLSYQDAFSNPVSSVTNTNIQTLAPPSISFASSAYNGVINTPISIATINTGGSLETYSIAPTLPTGLSFNTTTGLISGTPTVILIPATIYTVTATNAAGTDTESFTLYIDSDLDGDGIGNGLDPDIDGDGSINSQDVNPYNPCIGFNAANAPAVWQSQDCDGDGILNGIDSCPAIVNTSITTHPSNQDISTCPNTVLSNLTVAAVGEQLTYQWYSNTSNSNSGGILLTGATNASYVPSGSLIGLHYYYVVVSGSCGIVNSSVSGAFLVQDIVLPTVITQPVTVQLNATGSASITASQINNGSTDNCGIATITVSPSTFTCANVGANTVTLTVTDVNGNVATASATVTVAIDLASTGDNDLDGMPDNCDDDDDNDGVLDVNDNCPQQANTNQADNDQDGKGDICDNDDDNDGILDTVDNCPISSNSDQADRDRDGKGDVCDTVEINVSQAITPNGDGVNDTWVIYNLSNHPGSIVRVFNRWGKEVFYSADYQNNWTGHYKDNSEKLPTSGSYFYQIDLGGDGSIDAQGWLYITQ